MRLFIVIYFSTLFSLNAISSEISDFKGIINKHVEAVDPSSLEQKEKSLYNAAKYRSQRSELGWEYDNGKWINTKDSTTGIVNGAYRFVGDPVNRNSSSEDNDEDVSIKPTVISVMNDTVELNYLGVIGKYSEGDRVGRYYVEKVSIHEILLREENSKRHTLSTDWK